MDVLRALAICGGAARRPALARLGIDDAALRRAVRAGVLQPDRGLYALPTAAPDHVALLRRRQLLTCSSAAPFHRLWSVDSSGPIHVHHRRGEAFEGQIGHSGLLLEPHPHRPVAALGDVLLHALRSLPFAEALVMVDCAVGRGDMTVGFLRERLPGKRNGRARLVLDWVDRGAESMLEVKKDQRRNNVSVVRGYSVLRYFYDDVVHHPALMLAEVRAVLAGLNLLG